MRDLTRSREDAICVERRARQRTVAFLLRHGRVYPGKTTWGRGHWAGLLQQVMDHPAQQIVLQEYLDAVREASARVLRSTGRSGTWSPNGIRRPSSPPTRPSAGVPHRCGHRGGGSGDLDRFNNPKELMAFLGLYPRSTPAAPRCAGVGSPKPATAMPAESWWKRPGPTACKPGSPGTC